MVRFRMIMRVTIHIRRERVAMFAIRFVSWLQWRIIEMVELTQEPTVHLFHKGW